MRCVDEIIEFYVINDVRVIPLYLRNTLLISVFIGVKFVIPVKKLFVSSLIYLQVISVKLWTRLYVYLRENDRTNESHMANKVDAAIASYEYSQTVNHTLNVAGLQMSSFDIRY